MMHAASVHEAAAAATRGDLVIDVRSADEYASGHIPKARLMPLPVVPLRISELDRRKPVYVVCESGARAFQACQYLDSHGLRVLHVQGGMGQWRAQGLPVTTSMFESVG